MATKRPDKSELSLSRQGTVERLCVESVGKRDQLWVVVDEGGEIQTYFTWLDENYTIVMAQQRLLQDALVHGLTVALHYQEKGSARIFHAVTAIRG